MAGTKSQARRVRGLLRKAKAAAPPPSARGAADDGAVWAAHDRALARTREAAEAAQRIASSAAKQRAAAERLLAPQMREVIRLIAEPILQPIYDLASPRLCFGRVALIGDAAFVARPHVGAGVSKAADDAASLAQALGDAGDDIEAALRYYENERMPENNRIIERARHLGAYLQASQSAEERERSAQHGIPQAVLEETATVDFLNA